MNKRGISFATFTKIGSLPQESRRPLASSLACHGKAFGTRQADLSNNEIYTAIPPRHAAGIESRSFARTTAMPTITVIFLIRVIVAAWPLEACKAPAL